MIEIFSNETSNSTLSITTTTTTTVTKLVNKESLTSSISLKQRLNTIFFLSTGILFALGHIPNIFVLSRAQLKDSSYKFMCINSINNLIYILISISYPILAAIFHFEISNEKKSFLELLFFLIAIEYLNNCFALFNILMQLFLTIQRIFLLMNKPFFKNVFIWKVTFAFYLFSFVFNSPLFSIQTIRQRTEGGKNNQTVIEYYSLAPTSFGQTSFGRQVRPILISIRLLLICVVLSALNLFNYYLFKKYAQRKNNLLNKNQRNSSAVSANNSADKNKKRRNKTSNSIYVSLLVISIVMIGGTIPYTIFYTIKFVLILDFDWLFDFRIAAVYIYLIPHLPHIFLLYFVNPNYREVCTCYFKRVLDFSRKIFSLN
jgi:hypothetical protein